jgi:hypothetical protein
VESVWETNDLVFGLLEHCSSEQVEQMAEEGNEIAKQAYYEINRLKGEMSFGNFGSSEIY